MSPAPPMSHHGNPDEVVVSGTGVMVGKYSSSGVGIGGAVGVSKMKSIGVSVGIGIAVFSGGT